MIDGIEVAVQWSGNGEDGFCEVRAYSDDLIARWVFIGSDLRHLRFDPSELVWNKAMALQQDVLREAPR